MGSITAVWTAVYYTLFPLKYGGNLKMYPHCFSPLNGWGERVYYTLFPVQYGGNLKMYPTLFFPTVQMGERVYYTLFFPFSTVEIEFSKCTSHSFSPPYRWGERVYCTLFPFSTVEIWKCTPHPFSPPYRWGERVYYTLLPFLPFSMVEIEFSKIMYFTLFFPQRTDGKKASHICETYTIFYVSHLLGKLLETDRQNCNAVLDCTYSRKWAWYTPVHYHTDIVHKVCVLWTCLVYKIPSAA